jgi:malic enzyme
VKDGETVMSPSQANNMFVFPGIGLGVAASRATRVTDEMLYQTAVTLSECTTDEHIQSGHVFPDIRDIRDVSRKIATRVCQVAEEQGLARELPPSDEDWESMVKLKMYEPHYQPLLQGKESAH